MLIKNETGRGVQIKFYYPKYTTPGHPQQYAITEVSCVPFLTEMTRTMSNGFTMVEWMWWPKGMTIWNSRRWKPKQSFDVSPNQKYFVFQFADPDDDEVQNMGVL